MPKLLTVPFLRQEISSGCLPACAQMTLAYLGITHSQMDGAYAVIARRT